MARSGGNKPSQLLCPTCDILVDPSVSKSVPFCSERCRLIDLGRWLNEEIAVTCDRSEEEEDEGSQSSGQPRLPPGWHDA